MSLSETKSIDQITVTENGTILVREATRILRDGNQIAQTFHRWTFTPGSDLSEMPQNVKEIASVVWTSDIIQAYTDRLQEVNNAS